MLHTVHRVEEAKPPILGACHRGCSTPMTRFGVARQRRRLDGYWSTVWLCTYFSGLPLCPLTITAQFPPPPPSHIDCTAYGQALRAPAHNTPVRLGLLIHFGFEVDVLEIALHEYNGVVDWIFLVEATHAHQRMAHKPLIWETLQTTPRFRSLRQNVVHLILDDADYPKHKNGAKEDIWAMEYYQWQRAWERFSEWNARMDVFGPQDVIGLGDVDEVPSRKLLEHIRACPLLTGQFDAGIWFPYGRLQTAFRSDFPVPGHPFTLGCPTFYTMERIQQMRRPYASKQRGTTGQFALGGMHMTHYGYLPNQLLKSLTATEYGAPLRECIDRWMRHETTALLAEEMRQQPRDLGKRIVRIEDVPVSDLNAVHIPWLLRDNRKRYPEWDGNSDPRTC